MKKLPLIAWVLLSAILLIIISQSNSYMFLMAYITFYSSMISPMGTPLFFLFAFAINITILFFAFRFHVLAEKRNYKKLTLGTLIVTAVGYAVNVLMVIFSTVIMNCGFDVCIYAIILTSALILFTVFQVLSRYLRIDVRKAIMIGAVMCIITNPFVYWSMGTQYTLTSNLLYPHNDLTQDARERIQNEFYQTNRNFAVWPSRVTIGQGRSAVTSAAIKNDALDNESHVFVFNIIPSAASSSVCEGHNLSFCSSPDPDKSLYEYMQTWTTWERTQKRISEDSISYWDITLKIPDEAKVGMYMFNAIACWDKDNEDNTVIPYYEYCKPISENIWGGSAHPLTISVETPRASSNTNSAGSAHDWSCI